MEAEKDGTDGGSGTELRRNDSPEKEGEQTKAGEGHADEKGGHGVPVPAAFGESTVWWRSVLLGARATVSAKAAAGNLLATANPEPALSAISDGVRSTVSRLLGSIPRRRSRPVPELARDGFFSGPFERTGTGSARHLASTASSPSSCRVCVRACVKTPGRLRNTTSPRLEQRRTPRIFSGSTDTKSTSEQAPLRVRVLQDGPDPGHQQLALPDGSRR